MIAADASASVVPDAVLLEERGRRLAEQRRELQSQQRMRDLTDLMVTTGLDQVPAFLQCGTVRNRRTIEL